MSVKGSLAKFYLPDNTYTLTRNQTKDAICKLSDALHMDMRKGNVTRIDVSTNFIMQHEAKSYYNVLGQCANFTRSQNNETTLYYHSRGKDKRKTLIFYDKAIETDARNGVIPDVYVGDNLLRYEMRLNKRVKEQLKEAEINGGTLYDRVFYSKVVQLWADSYFKIDKKCTLKANEMDNIKTTSEAYDFICAVALQRMSDDEVNGLLQEMKNRKVFNDRMSYTRLKKRLNKIQHKIDIAEADDLVRELDGEIRQILTYKR